MATGKQSGKPAQPTPGNTKPGGTGQGQNLGKGKGTDSSIIKPARTPPSTSGGGKSARGSRNDA